jgi:hypothetical protein
MDRFSERWWVGGSVAWPSAAPWIDQQHWIGPAIPDSHHWRHELGSRRERPEAILIQSAALGLLIKHRPRGETEDVLGIAPRFEKMLYDNAQLARVYLHAWQVTGEPFYRTSTEETLDYVVRDPHLMWDFPHVICCCIRRRDSLRLHLLQSACSARASKTEKAAIMSSPITTNMRLAIFRTYLYAPVFISGFSATWTTSLSPFDLPLSTNQSESQ